MNAHLEHKGLFVDKVLDLEKVLPVGLTVDDASLKVQGVLEQRKWNNEH